MLLSGCGGPGRPDRPFATPPSLVPGAARGAPPVEPEAEATSVSSLGPLPLDEPFETLLAAARRLARLRTVRGFCDQQLETRGRSMLLRAHFLFARPGSIRYEYVDPVEQTILCDGELVWMLAPRAAQPLEDRDVPQPRRWVRRQLSALGATERASLGLIEGYGLDPLAPLPGDAFTYSYAQRGPRRATVLLRPLAAAAGKGARGALRVDLDPALGVVTGVRFYEGPEGVKVLGQVRYSDFEEALPGVYFARRARTRWHLPAGDLSLDARYRSLVFNRPIAAQRFRPAGGQGVPDGEPRD